MKVSRAKNKYGLKHKISIFVTLSIFDEGSFVNAESYTKVNFYNDVSTFDTQYVSPNKFHISFEYYTKRSLSILHVNIRSMHKSFAVFKQFYSSLDYKCSIIRFFKTWATDARTHKTLHLPNLSVQHQVRNAVCYVYLYRVALHQSQEKPWHKSWRSGQLLLK